MEAVGSEGRMYGPERLSLVGSQSYNQQAPYVTWDGVGEGLVSWGTSSWKERMEGSLPGRVTYGTVFFALCKQAVCI